MCCRRLDLYGHCCATELTWRERPRDLTASAIMPAATAEVAHATLAGCHRLRRSGWGRFYRARDTSLNRDVALKILPDAFVGGSVCDVTTGYA